VVRFELHYPGSRGEYKQKVLSQKGILMRATSINSPFGLVTMALEQRVRAVLL